MNTTWYEWLRATSSFFQETKLCNTKIVADLPRRPHALTEALTKRRIWRFVASYLIRLSNWSYEQHIFTWRLKILICSGSLAAILFVVSPSNFSWKCRNLRWDVNKLKTRWCHFLLENSVFLYIIGSQQMCILIVLDIEADGSLDDFRHRCLAKVADQIQLVKDKCSIVVIHNRLKDLKVQSNPVHFFNCGRKTVSDFLKSGQSLFCVCNMFS